MRYVSDRTGIIATLMIPLIILLGGRNNFLQWLTGINYGTFMVYHRHIARVMFILVVIHSVGFTVLVKDRFASIAAETYFFWGIIATISGGLIWIQAMLFFRRRWYEIFLLIHIMMAALFIAGTWIHVDELGYIWFVYPAVAVWCFDRLVRIGRLIAFGFPKAEITLLANDTLKVVVPKPSYWKSIPGGHAFIHFVKPTYFWQSHPFTFVDTPDDKNIVLYCKVKGGVTHSLYQLLAKQPGQTTRMTVAVEGPYGESTPAKYADSAV
ncbi:putative ferric reductase transmembrane component, partial [Candida tropicalis]